MTSAANSKLLDWLFNPFRFIAGWQALIAGLSLLVISAIHASFSDEVFNGFLHIGLGRSSAQVELAILLVLSLAMTSVLWIAGTLMSRSQFRLLDLVGTQWLAHWPFLLLSLVQFHIPGYKNLLLTLTNMPPLQIANSIGGGDLGLLLAMGALSLAALAWTLLLMYRSFAVSCNVKGAKAITTFIAAFFTVSFGSSYFLRLLS